MFENINQGTQRLNLKVIDIAKVCRICIGSNLKLREINHTKIPSMIEKCANVQVCKDDGLPNKVCVNCSRLVVKCYKFRNKVERSDCLLRQYVKQSSKIKRYDILNIALNEADIQSVSNINNDSGSNTFLPEPDTIELHHITEADNAKHGETIQLISDDPPPLVPLVPSISKYREDNCDINVQDLPKDTPPLIPINLLPTIDILEKLDIETIQYQCNICSEQFSSVTALKDHKLTICQADRLQCNICQKKFSDSKKLIGHLKGHMVSKDYGCEVCGKAYPNPSTLTVHMRTHTGERPFKCTVCSKGFARWAGLVGHMKVHAPEKSYTCETCGRCFKNASNLTRHKVRHTKESPYSCSFCERTFNQSDNLQVHIKMNHTNEKPFLCSKCGKSFVNSTRLNRHMWVHSGYKPHSCRTCQKQYSNLNDLRNHESRAHLGKNADEFKKYKCNKCDMKFFHPCRLARHKKSHGNSYDCHVCGRPFAREDSLIKHTQDKHKLKYLKKHSDDFKIYVEYHTVLDGKTRTLGD